MKLLLKITFVMLCVQLAAESKKPNILFVFSDQQAYDMVGCYGNEQIITPNIDQFASEGLLFNNCFSNNPICTPFRGMLMSGKYSHNNGAWGNDKQLKPGNGKKFAEVLSDAGYYTGYIGKWHLLGGDRDRNIPAGELRYGFDDVFYSNNCHVDYRAGHCFYFDENDQKQYFDKWEVYGQTDQAIAFLDQVKDKEEPFALFVSWHPPHDWGKFIGEDGEAHYKYDGPEELMAFYDRDTLTVRPGMTTTPDLLRMYHGHMATTTGVDIAFGQLMDKLEEIGADDNTLVVFTSDHGDMLEFANAELPKQYPHDYSSHIPFLLKYPGTIAKETTTDLLFSAVDIMPTILGLMDLDVPVECEGKNLSHSIVNGDEDAVDFVPIFLLQGASPYRGVITKDYTFSYEYVATDERKNVLFDRNNDPYQLTNLINDPNYADIVTELKAQTSQWMNLIGDDSFGPTDYSKLPAQVAIKEDGQYVSNLGPSTDDLVLQETLADFETSTICQKGLNCTGITLVNSNNGMTAAYQGQKFANIAGTTSTYAMKSIYMSNLDLDLTQNYFQGCFASYNYGKVHQFQVVFNFYSDHHLLTDTLKLYPFPSKQWSVFKADISSWEYANHITKIEIGRCAPGEYETWGGIFMLDYLGTNPKSGNALGKQSQIEDFTVYVKDGCLILEISESDIISEPLRCYDVEGKMVNVTCQRSDDSILINTQHFTSGLYFLSAVINEKRICYKFRC